MAGSASIILPAPTVAILAEDIEIQRGSLLLSSDRRSRVFVSDGRSSISLYENAADLAAPSVLVPQRLDDAAASKKQPDAGPVSFLCVSPSRMQCDSVLLALATRCALTIWVSGGGAPVGATALGPVSSEEPYRWLGASWHPQIVGLLAAICQAEVRLLLCKQNDHRPSGHSDNEVTTAHDGASLSGALSPTLASGACTTQSPPQLLPLCQLQPPAGEPLVAGATPGPCRSVQCHTAWVGGGYGRDYDVDGALAADGAVTLVVAWGPDLELVTWSWGALRSAAASAPAGIDATAVMPGAPVLPSSSRGGDLLSLSPLSRRKLLMGVPGPLCTTSLGPYGSVVATTEAAVALSYSPAQALSVAAASGGPGAQAPPMAAASGGPGAQAPPVAAASGGLIWEEGESGRHGGEGRPTSLNTPKWDTALGSARGGSSQRRVTWDETAVHAPKGQQQRPLQPQQQRQEAEVLVLRPKDDGLPSLPRQQTEPEVIDLRGTLSGARPGLLGCIGGTTSGGGGGGGAGGSRGTELSLANLFNISAGLQSESVEDGGGGGLLAGHSGASATPAPRAAVVSDRRPALLAPDRIAEHAAAAVPTSSAPTGSLCVLWPGHIASSFGVGTAAPVRACGSDRDDGGFCGLAPLDLPRPDLLSCCGCLVLVASSLGPPVVAAFRLAPDSGLTALTAITPSWASDVISAGRGRLRGLTAALVPQSSRTSAGSAARQRDSRELAAAATPPVAAHPTEAMLVLVVGEPEAPQAGGGIFGFGRSGRPVGQKMARLVASAHPLPPMLAATAAAAAATPASPAATATAAAAATTFVDVAACEIPCAAAVGRDAMYVSTNSTCATAATAAAIAAIEPAGRGEGPAAPAQAGASPATDAVAAPTVAVDELTSAVVGPIAQLLADFRRHVDSRLDELSGRLQEQADRLGWIEAALGQRQRPASGAP